METPQGLPGRGQRALMAVSYLVLLLLGLMQGMIGSFQYSQSPVPLVAILLDVAIFATCVLCGWGMRSFAGGLVPAVGWIIASFVLSMPSSHGSVIITNTTAGKWYLYGGAVAAVAGATAAFVAWARGQSRSPRPRPRQPR
ncbi:MAG TPA: DUF6113 family protein [Trebonia sp.]|jgi:hypothetical protein|nr:DUF6113 family protein [Trebonia sp.]